MNAVGLAIIMNYTTTLSYLYPHLFNLGVCSSILLITSFVFVASWIMSSQKAKRGRKARQAIENEQGLRTYTNKVNKKVYLSSTSLLPSRPLDEEIAPIFNLPRIKKEVEVPVIKQEVLETVENDVSNNLGVGANVERILQSSEIANVEKGVNTKNIFSVSHLSLNEEKSDSSVDCAASHQTAESVLDIRNIKREPLSRSSSTETVVAAEVPNPVQIPEDSETFQSSGNKRPLGITNEVSKKLKTLSLLPDEHCATDEMEVDPNICEDSLKSSPKKGSITVKSEYDIDSNAGDCNKNASAVGKTCHKSDDTLFFFSNIKSTIRNIVQHYSVGSENSSGALNEETTNKASSICSTNHPFSSKDSTMKPLSSLPGEHCSTSEMEVDNNIHEHSLNHSPKKCSITLKSEYNINSGAASADDYNKNASTVEKTCHNERDDALSILSNIKSSIRNIVQNYSAGFEHSSGTLKDETPNKDNISSICSTNYPFSSKNSTTKPLSSLPDENCATSEMEADTNIHANKAHFSPIFSTNSHFSPPSTTTTTTHFSSEKYTISTGNTYKNFMKIMNCNVKIVSTSVKDCLNILEEKYTVKKKFQLYFNNDRFESQRNKSAVEPVKPSADSFSSTEERNVSVEQLKKILQNLPKDTERLPNYPCSAINNKSAIESVKPPTDSASCTEKRNVSVEELKKILQNLPKDTERLPNHPCSAINNQSFDQTNNIRVKEEPLDDTPSTASKELTKSEELKTSFEETVFTKKVKTEPPEKMDVDTVPLDHSVTPVMHSQVSTHRSLVPQSDVFANLESRANKLQNNPNVSYDFSVTDNRSSKLRDFTPSTDSKKLTKSEGLKTSFEETILTKKIKTEPPEKIDVDVVPLDHNMTPVICSKVSKNRSLALQSDLCVNESSRAINFQNNPNVSYDFSVTDCRSSKRDHALLAAKPTKVSTNRSLLPQSGLCDNLDSRPKYDFSVSDCRSSKLDHHTVSAAKPTKVSANHSLVPQSDMWDNLDSRAKYDFTVTDYRSSKPDHAVSAAKPKMVSKNRSLVPQCDLYDNSDTSAMTRYLNLIPRCVDKTKNPTNICQNSSSRQDDKCSNEANATSTCKRIYPLAQHVSTSSNSTTARKKIRPKTSVKRISSHDPRVKKTNNPNSTAQVSSRSIRETTLKQPDLQTQNLTFTVNSRKTHRCKKSMSTCKTSNVQQKCLENVISSQNFSVTSESQTPVKLVSRTQNQVIAKTSNLIKNPSRKEPKLPLKYRSIGPSSTEFQK